MERDKTRHYKCRPGLDKKGFVFTDLFLMIAIVLIVIVVFAGFIYFTGQINTTIRDIGVIDGVDAEHPLNITQISDNSFGYLNIGTQTLRIVAILMFFGLMMSILVTSFLIRVHPVFFVVYLFILIIAIVFSFIISNVYTDLRTNEILGETMQSFMGMDYLIQFLPIVIIMVGCIAGILMFIGMSRDDQLGGGI